MGQIFTRSFHLDERASLDEEKRELRLSFSSEKPVRLPWIGDEILLHGEKNVDLSRLRNLGSLLLNHNPDRILGPVRKAWIENKRGEALVGFDEDEDGERALRKVKNKSLRGVSVRYGIEKARRVEEDEEWEGIKGPALVALRWTPFEISLTPIPADDSVGAARSLEGIHIINEEGRRMDYQDEERVRQMIKEAMAGVQIPSAEDVAQQVRNLLAEDARPRFGVTPDEYTDLMSRAGAIGDEAKIRVADMVAEGRGRAEIQNELLELATKKPDAGDPGNGPGGDGTGRDGQTRQAGKDSEYRSVKDIPDDVFADMINNPVMLRFQ